MILEASPRLIHFFFSPDGIQVLVVGTVSIAVLLLGVFSHIPRAQRVVLVGSEHALWLPLNIWWVIERPKSHVWVYEYHGVCISKEMFLFYDIFFLSPEASVFHGDMTTLYWHHFLGFTWQCLLGQGNSEQHDLVYWYWPRNWLYQPHTDHHGTFTNHFLTTLFILIRRNTCNTFM